MTPWYAKHIEPLGYVLEWQQVSELSGLGSYDFITIEKKSGKHTVRQTCRYAHVYRFGNSDLFMVVYGNKRGEYEIAFPADCHWTVSIEKHQDRDGTDPKTIKVKFDSNNSHEPFRFDYIAFTISHDHEEADLAFLVFEKIHKRAMEARELKKKLKAMNVEAGNHPSLMVQDIAQAAISAHNMNFERVTAGPIIHNNHY